MLDKETGVDYRVDGNGVAYLTLNRPEKHNAFDDVLISKMTVYLQQAAGDDNVRVLVLQAEGKHFCAGADLTWMQRMVKYSEQENKDDAHRLAELLDTLYRLPKPTIARVQGAAFGGAVGLIACCDIAVASKLSKFCLSEVKLGLIPATISPYVMKAMGERIARRYFMTAEVFSSRRARRLGLISETVTEDSLDTTIEEIVSALLKNGPHAVSAAKALSHDIAGKTIDADMLIETSERIAHIRVSEEGQEGLSAFLEKRAPTWRNDSQG
ncbi:enoyl-CoA hydratase/isomerase family protein [Alteromonas sediminis]|uniref:Enoyl-CoA hydratase/isomerase family protein n=1 Tax=Alteromonas sediminis TaxID=2259342 RepID=A0A3N5YNM2_9ALTE|nr:enoyl-CoA hydratase/isomerase family protein [Alteromonas sediminis]RPJ67271.1 enoyl-CoA hydratase/isomerase family protein [Alteromonas sediminis]